EIDQQRLALEIGDGHVGAARILEFHVGIAAALAGAVERRQFAPCGRVDHLGRHGLDRAGAGFCGIAEIEPRRYSYAQTSNPDHDRKLPAFPVLWRGCLNVRHGFSERLEMSNKMWGGRFASGPDAIMEEINASIGFDQRLFRQDRSEEHTSELQSRENLVCRLLLEKKKK